MKLKLVSYNLHKGKTILGRKFCLESLKSSLQTEDFDIGFFQEILGISVSDKNKVNQIEVLTGSKWNNYAFSKNSIIAGQEHGNLILSKYLIEESFIIDLTLNKLEKRNALVARVRVENRPIYCICTHLSLLQADRSRQIQMILDYLNKRDLQNDTQMILGGDFNDWNGQVSSQLRSNSNLDTISEKKQKKTFPSIAPIVALDRFFVNKEAASQLDTFTIKSFSKYSDHLPLFAKIDLGDY